MRSMSARAKRAMAGSSGGGGTPNSLLGPGSAFGGSGGGGSVSPGLPPGLPADSPALARRATLGGPAAGMGVRSRGSGGAGGGVGAGGGFQRTRSYQVRAGGGG